MTKDILVPVSTTENITSFSDHARKRFQQGKLSYEKFCNIEMIELGYNPSKPEDIKEYNDFIESLSDIAEEFDVDFISEMVFGPIDGEDSRVEIICNNCGTLHLVGTLEWERMICLQCSAEIQNPYNKEKE